jgi:hypothetical protein
MATTYTSKGLFWISGISVLFLSAVALHGELCMTTAILLMGICFTCELVDSGLGMGYGTILTPTLLLLGYSPMDIVPTVLLSELLSGFTAAFFHHQIRNVDLSFKSVEFKAAAILAMGSIVGVTIGVSLAVALPVKTLSLMIGSIICISGVAVIVFSRRGIPYRKWKMLILSFIASFNKAMSGGGYGPLVTSGQILSGVHTKASVGITSFAEAFTCLLAVSLFLVKGGKVDPVLFIPMCTGALLSVPFAVFAVNRARELYLKRLIGLLTLVMGTLTIVKALS